ncbi:glycerol 3-phosphatase 1 [Blastomyces dermatitidis ER-3]|uniref:Glycerol 3-phosphatase 1 n=1 Tax=Ajellomyces dermatitidis (strain ER-3 / ATCC MYA-2586) TaxID=559297 RepID=A0ABP2F314_AJEDR|nr:glycerol 3-phosphatase 1 [Blastomyces dermatitidis ER-3]EEQ90332.1 glycerol 3-phosphatase 1 [Blastomyces dermatitidis ER-3]
MGSSSPETFTAPAQTFSFDGLLFDFDGTIIDSTPAIVKHWHRLGAELNLDPEVILKTSHGRRSIDVLQIIAPEKANWEYVSYVEGRIPREDGRDAVEIPGARQLLDSLDEAGALWAVVTSGTKALVHGWLEVMKLAHPKYMVVAEDVEVGKPDPRCYLLGRSRLGLGDGAEMLVVEDAPSGIRAGKAAGFKVVALTSTHKIEQLKEAGADWIVQDLRSVTLKGFNGKVEIEISNALQ